MNTHIPLVQAGFIKPILDSLDTAGVSVPKLLHSVSLHRFDLSDSENYIPVELMHRFFEETMRREGIDDFIEVFGDQLHAKGMSDYFDMIVFSPDLLSAINFATEYDGVFLTNERMDFEINGPVCKFSQYFLDQAQYLERPHLGRDFTDYADFCLAYNFFKQAAEPGWEPLEIHLQSLDAPNFDKLLSSGSNTKIYLGQPATALVFPTAMLTVPLTIKDPEHSARTFENTPQTLSGSIEKLLHSARDGQVANLELMADMFGISPSTLRRRLRDEGTTFSEIVDGWRFKSSLDLLGQGDARIREISERLGYANAPNFERAFKRWTGQTPGAYRDALPA